MNQIYLIRHANSEWNHRAEINKKNLKDGAITEDQYEKVRREIYADYSLIDSPLSHKGCDQCTAAISQSDTKLKSELTQTLPDVSLVYVSPLRRCLETAHRLFKDHPNFTNIQFVVEPLIREQLHASCDVPGDINITLQEYSKKFQKLDTSLLPKLPDGSFDCLWFLETLQSDLQNELKPILNGCQGGHHQQHLLDFIMENSFPLKIESFNNTKKRADKFKEKLQSLKDQHQQVAVVAHKNFFTFMYAENFKQVEVTKTSEKRFYEHVHQVKPQDCREMNNCELFPFDSFLAHTQNIVA